MSKITMDSIIKGVETVPLVTVVTGATAVGKLKVVDIGIPHDLDDHLSVELISDHLVTSLLPQRPIDSHKNTFGRLLVVAGSRRYVGAACLQQH